MLAAFVTAVVRDAVALCRYRVRRDSIERLAAHAGAGAWITDTDRDGSLVLTVSGARPEVDADGEPFRDHELGRGWA